MLDVSEVRDNSDLEGLSKLYPGYEHQYIIRFSVHKLSASRK